jgi:hypothetical protein
MLTQERPLKVQARHAEIGDLLVQTRTSPLESGRTIIGLWRDGKNVRVLLSGMRSNDDPVSYPFRQDLYVFRSDG